MTVTSQSTPGALAHAIVATGLVDPNRLSWWRADPTRLVDLGVDPSTLDLEGLADFAGMSEKVRHNPCRDDLQLTFRLLLISGMEIALFRDYAPISLERRRLGLNSTLDRIAGLAEFALGWSPDTDQIRSLIRDVIGHEHVLALLRRAEVPPRPGNAITSRPATSSTPVHNGLIVVRTWTCDPRQVREILHARKPDLARIHRGSWTFAYHKGTDGRVRMFDTDRAVGDLLLAVDGNMGIADMARHLKVETDMLAAALDQLSRFGLLLWPRCEGFPGCE